MKKLIYVIIALFMLSACSDDDDNGSDKAVLSVRLTDAPADYQEVLIDIQDVMINTSEADDPEGWESLNIMYPGVYDLLDFTNGIDTLLVERELPAGTISQMRLVLGNNNQVKDDGTYYDLTTPSAQSSGLKFNVHADLIEGINYTVWIDFDAGRSVVDRGNGEYNLKPVIRAYTEAINGAIIGVVDPVEAKPYIMAISVNNDTIGSYADTVSGEFLLGGLEQGEYLLHFEPVEEYMQKTLDGVNVINGEVTELDTVKIEMVMN